MGAFLRGRDLLTIADLGAEDIWAVLDLAKELKNGREPGMDARRHESKAVALILEKPSLRTRVSFEVACHRLGMHPVILGGSDNVFSRGESVHDSIKTLERYVDAICVRTFEQSKVEEIANLAEVPVVNMLTDEHHPCQGLADLMTIVENFGRLSGLRFAYVGDGNNMANTYLLAGATTGMEVAISCPHGYRPHEAILARAQELALENGGRIELAADPGAAVRDAQVVVTDTWTSMGQEDEHQRRLEAFEGYIVDPELMGLAATDAIFLHCLPAHRGEEVADEVIDAPYSKVFDEAENRLHAQQALLALLLG
ncbi:MAG: ornithine carbamoyltransferase [Actinobacteria bacterium]|nr:ornithine carbamoyltransferase [Actinomycetota bacterium]MCL5886803.1 ornithine carbamoyltransferase [Actinomycetota bacterium]